MKFITTATAVALMLASLAIPPGAFSSTAPPQMAAIDQYTSMVSPPAPEVAAPQELAGCAFIAEAIKIDGQIAQDIAASPPPAEHINAFYNSITATHVTPASAASPATHTYATAPPPLDITADFGANQFATASAIPRDGFNETS